MIDAAEHATKDRRRTIAQAYNSAMERQRNQAPSRIRLVQ